MPLAIPRAIVESHFWQHALQIRDVHRRRVTHATSSANRARAARPYVLIQLDAELRRALEDVKELAEWQEQQRRDHRDGVEDGEKRKERAAQPGDRDGERQAR